MRTRRSRPTDDDSWRCSDQKGCLRTTPSGTLLWQKDLGLLDSGFFQVPEAQWGFASSPVIHGDRVIVQADVLKGSFLAAFDVATGTRALADGTERLPDVEHPDRALGGRPTQVIVNGFKHVGGYDLATGKELWRMKGGGDIPVPTPIVHRDLAIITNAHGPAAPIFAVRPGATGDISLAAGAQTNNHIAWSQQRDGAYMQTPIVYGEQLYVCRDNGVLSVYEAQPAGACISSGSRTARPAFRRPPWPATARSTTRAKTDPSSLSRPGPSSSRLRRTRWAKPRWRRRRSPRGRSSSEPEHASSRWRGNRSRA